MGIEALTNVPVGVTWLLQPRAFSDLVARP